jgi:teichuronic acid biosynthesis glycosyltransferase TuaC
VTARDFRPDQRPNRASSLTLVSLSTEFPNPLEPAKGLFVRSRLQAVSALVPLIVVAPVALVDYANPNNDFLAALRIPRERRDGALRVLHPRWIYPPYGGWVNGFLLSARVVWTVARLRAAGACTVIDAHYAHPEGVAAAFVSSILRVPFMVTMRGSELRYQRSRFKRFWIGWALRRANLVVAVSNGLKELALGLGVDPSKAKTIPNGINSNVFFRRRREGAREQHQISPDARVILCAGDLAELKGHHKVIRALAALRQENTDIRLLIAGGVGRSGRYAHALRDEVVRLGVHDRVRFLGEVKQTMLAELMSAADVFCLASSSEGWPNVVNEALACGTPVVATDVGAVQEMIPSSDYGLVVPPQEQAMLEQALRTALDRTWDHELIARWGRSRSWDAVAADVVRVIQETIPECRAFV